MRGLIVSLLISVSVCLSALGVDTYYPVTYSPTKTNLYYGSSTGPVACSPLRVTDLIVEGDQTLQDTVWDDATVSAVAARGGVTAPSFAVMTNGVYAQFFSDSSQDDELHGQVQMPHRYKPGTDVYAHIHTAYLTSPAGGNSNVVWELKASSAPMGGAFTNWLHTIKTNGIPSGAVSWRHVYIPMGNLGKSSQSASIIFVIRRLQSDGGDTYPNPIPLLDVDFHYQSEMMGSDNEIP